VTDPVAASPIRDPPDNWQFAADRASLILDTTRRIAHDLDSDALG